VINPNDVQQNRVIAALSYCWIISIFVYLLKKDSAFAQFHAKQSLVLTLITLVFGWWGPIGMLIWVAAVIAYVVGFSQALAGKYWEMPLIADLAKKLPN